ncbi:hypothetical protein MBLNU13_g01776t1 [Cladosporium sp. NU13]
MKKDSMMLGGTLQSSCPVVLHFIALAPTIRPTTSNTPARTVSSRNIQTNRCEEFLVELRDSFKLDLFVIEELELNVAQHETVVQSHQSSVSTNKEPPKEQRR